MPIMILNYFSGADKPSRLFKFHVMSTSDISCDQMCTNDGMMYQMFSKITEYLCDC